MASDFERLARVIKATSAARGWLQEDLIRESAIGRSTIQRLWKGKAGVMPSPAIKRQLQDTFSWTAGSVDAILAGGDPIPLDRAVEGTGGSDRGREDSFVKELRVWPGLSEQMRERLIAAYVQNKRERLEAAAA